MSGDRTYSGLAGGAPRATAAWPRIELIDDRSGNQFKVIVRRSEPHTQVIRPIGIGLGSDTAQPESQPESLEARVLQALQDQPRSKAEISVHLGQKEDSGQLNKVMRDLLAAGVIAHTILDKPNSRLQKFRLTQNSLASLAEKNKPDSTP